MAKKKSDEKEKTLESWLWDAACAIRGAQDAPKYKDFILPLVFVKRLCDVFDDEVNKMKEEVGSRKRVLSLIDKDHKYVRFFLPMRAKDIESDETWSVIKLLQANEKESIGQQLTDIMKSIAKENSRIDGIINRIDYNATTHGHRDMDDDLLSLLINRISEKRLGLNDVEPDIIGRSYEYLIRKFAEGGGQSAGEFYTPKEVGLLMAKILNPEPGMECYDPNCGSAGLLIKLELALEKQMELKSRSKYAPLKLFGQEFLPSTWAMANMNMVIHEMEGEVELGNTMTKPSRFKYNGKGLKKFDLVVANPMWNQDNIPSGVYENDELERFGKLIPPDKNADWGWVLHINASLNKSGRAAIILDTGSVTRGSGNDKKSVERDIRKHFVENDFIESIILLPENIFYNTTNAGICVILNHSKKKKNEILMIDLTEFYDRDRPKNFLSPKGFNEAMALYNEWQNKIDVSTIATIEDIRENDYNLLPSRYVKRNINSEFEALINERFKHEAENFRRVVLSNYLANYIKRWKTKTKVNHDFELGMKNSEWQLKDLDKVMTGSEMTFSELKLSERNIPVLSLTKEYGLIEQSKRFGHSVAIEDLSKYKIVRKGWLVYNPMVIWEGAIHILQDVEIGVVSPAYEVWIPNDIDFRYLDYITKTPKILDEYRRLASGGVKRRRIVSASDFKTIKILVPKKKCAEEIENGMNNILEHFDAIIKELSGSNQYKQPNIKLSVAAES